MKSIKNLIHPYIFVLKEGNDIEKNRLDYSLMMLKIGPSEHFPSPAITGNEKKKDLPIQISSGSESTLSKNP